MADDQKDLAALNAARRALGGGDDNPLPAGTGALQRQADQLANMGDWGQAAEDVNRRLLEMDPQRKVAMTRLARCLRDRGDAEAAEALYREILALDPANMIASNFLRGLRLKRERAVADELEAAVAAKKEAAAAKKAENAIKKAAAAARKADNAAKKEAAAARKAAAAPGADGNAHAEPALTD
jgi:tetratricopeptide (TPR) repeat protein